MVEGIIGTRLGRHILAIAIMICFMGSMFTVPMDHAEAGTATYLKYHHDSYTTGLNVWTSEPPEYLKVEFQNAKEYMVTGMYMSYVTVQNSDWMGEVKVEDWATSEHVWYDFKLPKNVNEPKAYYESFEGPEYMITSNMFSMALYPKSTESNAAKISAELIEITEQTHTYNWIDEQWKPVSTGVGTYELILSAQVETISELKTGVDGVGGTMDNIDNVDIYKVLFVGGKTYSIELQSPSRKPYALRLYEIDDIIKDPIMETSGMADKDKMVFKPDEDVFMYLVLEYPNNGGFIDYSLKVVPNLAPVARIDGDTLVNVNETARFTAENSTDDDNNTLTWVWDFDASDGIQEDASKKTPSYVYRTPGTYTITLTVSDGMENDTATWDIKVNSPPAGRILVDGGLLNETTRLNFDQEYTFKADYKDPDGDKMTFSWDFGDNGTGTGQTAKHTFSQEGTYTITVDLEVKDVRAVVKDSIILTFNQLPEASFDEPPEVVTAGSKVNFDGIGRDWDGEIKEYRWDFDGDGIDDKTTAEPYTDYKFKKPGIYNVTLSIVDDNDGIGKANVTVEVKSKPAEQRNLAPIIGGVVALVVVLLIVVILVLKKQGKIMKAPPEEEVEGAPTQASPPTTDQAQAQPGQAPPQQPAEGAAAQQPYQPSPDAQMQPKPGMVPPPKPAGAKPGGPTLVPPPKPTQGPKLVPPPKPTQGPKMVPPPKPTQGPKNVPPPKPQ
jgi:PKD repeat protein